MKKFNKMLSVLLSLMLCLGMVSPAFAHVVAIDGVEGTQDVDTVQAGVDKISESERKSGTITMTEDETTASTITVGDGNEKVDVTLNLNGNNLTGEGDVISVEENASLTINGGKAEPDEGDEPETPDTPDETDEGGEDEPETPAEEPKGTIKGDVENKGTLTVSKAKVDGNVRNSGKFYLDDSAVAKTVYNSEDSIFVNSNSTVGNEGTLGSYGYNGGTYTLETVTGGQKLTIYPDSTKKVSGSNNINWFKINNIPSDGITEVVIADGVETIGNDAFKDCAGLTSVTIGDDVKTIGLSAFDSCTGLTNVTIPGSVTSIEQAAFNNCTGLTSVTIGEGVKTIGQSAFYSCAGLTNVTIPGSVKTIGANAFRVCGSLKSVTISEGVESIGSSAFGFCSKLTSVEIPNSVTTIGARAFENCERLTEVTIPNSVETIEQGAFGNCTGLTSVTIPDSVKTIGASAFSHCEGLKSVTIPNSVETIKAGAFNGCKPHRVIRSSDDGETVTYYLKGADGFNYSQDVNDFYGNPGNPSVTKNADGTVVVSGEKKIEIEAVNGKNPVITENDGSITVTAGCKTVTVDERGSITEKSLGHTEVTDGAVEPTCTKTGLTGGSHCSVCGTVTTAQKVVDTKGHTYGEWVVTTPAKPGKAGVETRTCSVCGKTETQAIAAQPVTTPVTGGGTPDYPVTGGITQIEDEAVPLAAGPVTRAEFIDYLWRHEGRPESDGVCTFTDVEKDHEYILALAWAEQNGIIEANEDGTFEPDELVTVAAVRDILDNFAEVFGLDVDVTALASLTGEDDEAVLNCDEVIAEFFRKETEEQKAA